MHDKQFSTGWETLEGVKASFSKGVAVTISICSTDAIRPSQHCAWYSIHRDNTLNGEIRVSNFYYDIYNCATSPIYPQ